MEKFIFLLIVFVILILFFVLFRILYKSNKLLLDKFRSGNVLVYGQRGTGKDVLFNYIIHKRKDSYYSNLNYGGKFNYIKLTDISLGNDFYNFIEDKINVINKDENREGKDIYISDCGIYFPSSMDKELHKRYKDLPVYFGLSRHAYNSQIHSNCQDLMRIWKPLREQSHYFVKTLKTINIFNLFFIVKFRSYDRMLTAEEDRRPMKSNIFSSKDFKARVSEYNAKYGEIFESFVIVPRKVLKYDSRAFHEKIFGKKF